MKLLKSILLLILGFLLIAIFFYMKESVRINEFLAKAKRIGTGESLEWHALIGFVQYGCLVVGISVVASVIIVNIRKKEF